MPATATAQRPRGSIGRPEDMTTQGNVENMVVTGAASVEWLNGMMMDIQEQPDWRGRASVECDYYDGHQYDAATLIEMRNRGIPPIVVNLIHPTINLVLGLEAKTRSDWQVKADDEQDELLALGLSKEMKKYERLSGADNACGEAYASQIKAGLGWVECGLNLLNPFGERFRASFVHRREIWWDWHDEDMGLDKARWLMRKKWYDLDVCKAMFPEHANMFEECIAGWAHFDPTGWDESELQYMDESCERRFNMDRDEWCNPQRKLMCLYELWYRTIERGYVVRSRDGKQVYQFDPKNPNPVHIAAVESGAMTIEPAIIPKMRMSWWCGPHRLIDIPSPYPHQWFPYVPFWGFREDRTNAPYGMIRMMKPLQDEINARRAKMMWQLSAVTVQVDDDAVLDHDKLMREVGRPDAYIKMNSKRMNKTESALKIDRHVGITAQQFDVYMDAKQTLQDAGGVYQQQLGKDGAADSGIAISQLIEQGTTTLAKINSNYRFGRTRLGEILLTLIQQDMAGRPFATVVEHKGMKKKINWNRMATDPNNQGMQYLENDITRTRMRMALADIPQTPTFRAQQLMQLTELVKSLPENIQGMVIDLVIKATDLPEKDELISRIREQLGINATDPTMMTEGELAQFQQAQAQQAEMQEMQNKLLELEAALSDATAKQKIADAKLKDAQTAKTYVEVGLDPVSMMEPTVQVDDPIMNMVDAAMADAESDVPGADPALLERARGGGAPRQSVAQRVAGPGTPPASSAGSKPPTGGKKTPSKQEA